MANQIQSWAEGIAEKYAAQVSRILGVPVADLTIVVGKTLEGRPAETSGTTITLNAKWFRDHPDDAGAVVHEMVHAYQQVTEGGKPKRIEAMADAVRLKLGLTYEGWQPSDQAAKLAALDDKQFRRASRAISSTDQGGQGLDPAALETAEGFAFYASGADVQAREGSSPVVAGAGNTSGDISFDVDAEGEEGKTDEEKKAARQARIAEAQREANMQRAFLSQVSSMGIGITPNVKALIDQGVNKNYSATSFLYFLRQTPEYAKEFPGIFNQDGSMKMSEAQYLSNVSQYESIAAQAGINLGPKQTAWLFKNDVSPSEYGIKAPAVARVKRDPQLYQAFQRELIQSGTAQRGEVNMKNILRMAAGMGNRAWADLWQDTVTRNAAIDAGIAIKKGAAGYASITQQMLEGVSAKGLSEEDAAARFADLAEHLLTTLPEGVIQGYGDSQKLKRKLATAEFGGPGAAQTKQLVKRIAANAAAFGETRATAQTPDTRPGGVIAPQRPEA